MLTPSQQETAAREFCKMLGKDPDGDFECVDGDGNEGTMKNWQCAVTPIMEHLCAHHAISIALKGKVPVLAKHPYPQKKVSIIPFNGNDSGLRRGK